MLIAGSEHHFKVIRDGLPNDAKIVGCAYDNSRRSFTLQIESREYPPIFEGNLLLFVASPVIQNIEAKEFNHAGYSPTQ